MYELLCQSTVPRHLIICNFQEINVTNYIYDMLTMVKHGVKHGELVNKNLGVTWPAFYHGKKMVTVISVISIHFLNGITFVHSLERQACVCHAHIKY